MQTTILLVSLLAITALFVGVVIAVRRAARRLPEREQKDTMLRDGIILAVLIPVVGLLWSARLFAKDRYGHGLAVLVVSGTMILAYFMYAAANH